MSWDPGYRDVWQAHQEKLAEAGRAAQALREAEMARDLAQDEAARADKTAEVDRLRDEKVAAETAITALEMEVAQTDPQRAAWLDERIPPADGPAREADPLAMLGHETLSTVIEQAAHLDGAAMQVVATTIEALPTPGEVALWAESTSTAKLIETAETLGHAPGALPPEVLAANARLVERLDTFEQNRDDILAPPETPPPTPELDERHAQQQEALDRKLDEMRAMQEARIDRGDVRDPDALRAAMDAAAERERQMLEQRHEAERQRAAMEQAERAAMARREAEMLAARQR